MSNAEISVKPSSVFEVAFIATLVYHKEMTRLCVGCGACLGLCPNDAISLRATNEVFTIDFDYSRCTNCGLCRKACPALCNLYRKRLKITEMLGRIERVFFSCSTDQNIRYHGASGGVITTLALYMLEQKIVDRVLVTKMDGFTATPVLTDDKNDIIRAQGSIYFKTFSLRILKKLASFLKKGKRICIIGLPCQISTLKNILSSYYDKLLFISFVCNHVNEIWYLQHIIDKYLPKNAKPTAIGSRKDGWPGKIKISFELQKAARTMAISLSNFWGIIPSLNISSPVGCLLCADDLASCADIVTADAWHPKFSGKNSSGTSIMIARTARGLDLIEAAVRDRALYAEATALRDLLIAQGSHLIEGTLYTPLRQKILQRRIGVLRELKQIDKIAIVLLVVVNQHALRSETARRLLSTSTAEKILKVVSLPLSWCRSKRLSQSIYARRSIFS